MKRTLVALIALVLVAVGIYAFRLAASWGETSPAQSTEGPVIGLQTPLPHPTIPADPFPRNSEGRVLLPVIAEPIGLRYCVADALVFVKNNVILEIRAKGTLPVETGESIAFRYTGPDSDAPRAAEVYRDAAGLLHEGCLSFVDPPLEQR